MHIAVSFLLVLVATVATYADPQYLYALPQPYPYDAVYPVEPNYFRANLPSSSIENIKPEERLFFGTVTITLATSTFTSTLTTSTTCTSSSTSLTVCSSSGRRRRGFMMLDESDDKSKSLFYKEEVETAPESQSALVEPKIVDVERVERSSLTMVPFILQPGFSAPDNVRNGRFLVAFGTSTVTTTTTSTYTAVLTATCSSTSGFATCNNAGK